MNRPSLRAWLPRVSWPAVLPFAAVGAFFWAVYLLIGAQLEAHHVLRVNDLFFNSDTFRILGDMCISERGHKRTHVHPIFLLIMNPLGSALNHLTGSPFTSAIIMVSFTGALAIAVAGSFFHRVGVPLRRSLLLCLILGFSSAHLFFGSSPETFSLSAVTIILLFHAAVRRPGSLPHALAAGVFSFGVLITNLGMVCATFFTCSFPGKSVLRVVVRTFLLVLCTVTITAGLAWVQKQIWPSSRPFYIVKVFHEEGRFVDQPQTGWDIFQRELRLLRHVFVYDWFSPQLEVYKFGRIRMKSDSLSQVQPAGLAAVVLWFALLATSAWALLRSRFYLRPAPVALFLCLLFNLLLHTLYGDDLFLYACNTCFLVLALLALGLQELPLSLAKNRLLDLALAVLLALQITNNYVFVQWLLVPRLTVSG